MPKRYGQRCPVAKSLELVGDRWTLLLVRDLLAGARRFQDFHDSLPGIPPNILSQRLKLMEEHALVRRRLYSAHPPRAEYVLTPKGQELGVVVAALASWGTHHVQKNRALVHAECGHAVELKYFCAHCADRVPGRSVTLTRRVTRPRGGSVARATMLARGVTAARRGARAGRATTGGAEA